MLNPILLGLLAAVVSIFIQAGASVVLFSKAWVFLVLGGGVGLFYLWALGALGALTHHESKINKPYDGLADLFIQIHSPEDPDSTLRWALHGLVSMCLALFGGVVGAEGAALEFSYAFASQTRVRALYRFDQIRRGDVVTSISAGLAATFGAPFAAILVPIELGMGGRTLSTVTGALSALFGVHFLAFLFRFKPFSLKRDLIFLPSQSWVSFPRILQLFAIIIGAGLFGAALIFVLSYFRRHLTSLFESSRKSSRIFSNYKIVFRVVFGGILLWLITSAYPAGHLALTSLFKQVVTLQFPSRQLGLLLFFELCGLAFALGCFGTAGIFWPLFLIGATFGSAVNQLFFHSGASEFHTLIIFAGSAGLWGSVLGTPLAGGVLAYELTGNLEILAVSLLSGLVSQWIRQSLKMPTLIHSNLKDRGAALVEGRSLAILNSILVKDVIVTDCEIATEHESIYELHSRLRPDRYPFVPVVNANGGYIGLLTAEQIERAYSSYKEHEQGKGVASGNTPEATINKSKLSLTTLFEVKDLLYLSGLKVASVKSSDNLSVTIGLFRAIPCLPALSDDGKVEGLLFAYNVRLAYDKEVARRSMQF